VSLSDEKDPFPITALGARGPYIVDATKFESSEESSSRIVEVDGIEEEGLEEVVAATFFKPGFLDARIFFILFA
jgi:hypothetical protein